MVKNYGTYRVVVGAHYGLKDWLLQSIGTVVLALAALYIVTRVLLLPGSLTYETWTAIFAATITKFIFSGVIVIVAYHFWVTLRDVWMDYVKPVGIKLILFTFTVGWLIGCAAWLINVLWRI